MPLNNFGIVDVRENGAKFFRSAQPDVNGCISLERLGVTCCMRLNEDSEFTPQTEQEALSGEVFYTPIQTFSVDIETVKGIVGHIHELLNDGKSIVVHCTHGRDRTGLIVGAYRLMLDGWTLERVHEERQTYGVNLLIDICDHEIAKALGEIASEKPVQ